MLPSCRAFYHQFCSHPDAKSKTPTKSVNFLWRGKRNVVFNMNFEKIHSNTKFLLTKLPCSTLCSSHQKRKYQKWYFLFWRRRRDSNSRAGYPTYALSRGASSPTWVLLQVDGLNLSSFMHISCVLYFIISQTKCQANISIYNRVIYHIQYYRW